MNPLRRVWNWILWWPLRDLMPRPSCQTMERAFGQFDRCGHTDEEIVAHPNWTCPEAMDYHERVEVQHPYRHPDPHSHAGVDSCFVCEEHAEATGCVAGR